MCALCVCVCEGRGSEREKREEEGGVYHNKIKMDEFTFFFICRVIYLAPMTEFYKEEINNKNQGINFGGKRRNPARFLGPAGTKCSALLTNFKL